jgi:hypothetical protein
LIDLLRDRKKKKGPWYTTTRAAALALGRIGPDARAAIPILREVAGEKNPVPGSAVVALSQLAPDGKEQVKKWLERPRPSGRVAWRMDQELEDRAMVLGAMGRPGLEADALVRHDLELLDDTIDGRDREGYGLIPEWIIRQLGRFGIGGRLAVPRLTELRRHRDPWIRLWAGEALARIKKSDAMPSSQTSPTGR